MTASLTTSAWDEDTALDAWAEDVAKRDADRAEARAQATVAAKRLTLDAYRQPRVPWDSLHDVVGPIWPGEFWVIAAASGQGKTTALMNLVHEWATAGRRVWVLPLEQSADRMRLYWAAFALGFSTTAVLQNDLTPHQRGAIREHLRWQMTEGAQRVGFSRLEVLTPGAVVKAFDEAVCFGAGPRGAELLVIDHLNHMGPDRPGGNRYDALTEICQAIVGLGRACAASGLAVVAAAQLGRDREGDILAPFLPPKETAIQGGEVIRQTCHVALGLYRPLRQGLDAEDLRAMRSSRMEIGPQLEPDTIGVRVLKHRTRGSSFGQIVKLGFEKGRITCPQTTDRLTYEARNDL